MHSAAKGEMLGCILANANAFRLFALKVEFLVRKAGFNCLEVEFLSNFYAILGKNALAGGAVLVCGSCCGANNNNFSYLKREINHE